MVFHYIECHIVLHFSIIYYSGFVCSFDTTQCIFVLGDFIVT